MGSYHEFVRGAVQSQIIKYNADMRQSEEEDSDWQDYESGHRICKSIYMVITECEAKIIFRYFNIIKFSLNVGSSSDITFVHTDEGEKAYAVTVVSCRVNNEIGFMLHISNHAPELEQMLTDFKETLISDGINKYHDLVYMYPVN